MAEYCIGIDLGGTFIKFITLGRDLKYGEVFQLPTPCDSGPDAVVDQMVCGAMQAMGKANLTYDDIAGVGIGSPGPLVPSKGIICSLPNIKGMEDFQIRDKVGEKLGIPAVLENDACAAAYGEFLCGVGKGSHDMVMLTLGTGVGGGIIINGRLFRSVHEVGAHLGHMIIVPDGRQCGCGQRGCLERYCSARFIAEIAEEKLKAEQPSGALAEIYAKKGSIDALDIERAAFGQQDAFAHEIWDRSIELLAIGCVNICRIFDPDRIVLAGGMTKAGQKLLKPLREHFVRQHWKMTDVKTEIAIASLGSDSGAIGAGGVAWEAFGGES